MQHRIKLNAWQRLWLATGVVYLLCILATCSVILPDSDQIGHEMVISVIDEVRKYDPFAYIGDAPRTIYDQARKEGYENWEKRLRKRYATASPTPGFDRIEKAYSRADSDLPAARRKVCLMLALGWLLPMALLSVINRTARWIMAGSVEKTPEEKKSGLDRP